MNRIETSESRTPARLTAALVALLAAVVLTAWSSALAGSGYIHTSGENKGDIDITVKYLYPPPAWHVQNLKAAITEASAILCDATEGQIRLGTVRLTGGSLVNIEDADIVIRPDDGRSHATLCNSELCPPDECDTMNCSSLDKPGHRITIYEGDISGHIIAHEMGHYAFDLQDEYDEQPKIMGKCMECDDSMVEPEDVSNATHNCLMQEMECGYGVNGDDATELCSDGHHDLVMGDPLLPACTDPETLDCAPPHPQYCPFWNAETCRYELTMQSARSYEKFGEILSCWSQLAWIYPWLDLENPVAQPVNSCQNSGPVFQEDIAPADEVMLVLDRSWSMNFLPNVGQCQGPNCPEICDTGHNEDQDGQTDEPDCTSGNRMEFLDGASKAFLRMLKDPQQPTGSFGDAGIVSFSCNVTEDVEMQPVTFGSYNNAFKDALADLEPNWDTAIGDALFQAAGHFPQSEGMPNRDVLLITDGWQNCGDKSVQEGIDKLKAEDISLYIITMGNKANPGLEMLATAALETGGKIIPLMDERAIVPAMLQQWADYSHVGMLIPKLRYRLFAYGTTADPANSRGAQAWVDGQENPIGDPGIGDPFLRQNFFDVLIEPGTEEMVLSLAGDMEDMAGFGVQAILHGPAGNNPSYFDSDVAAPDPYMQVEKDSIFTMIQIDEPNPGLWTIELRVSGDNGVAPTQTGNLTVLAKNTRSELLTQLDRHHVGDATDPVRIGLDAVFDTALRGADFEVTLRRPDGAMVPLPVTDYTFFDAGYGSKISNMPLQGLYEVRIMMKTTPGTTNHPGESIWDDSPSNETVVPALIRTAVEYFWVEAGEPPCVSSVDCDGDGVTGESQVDDADGDGLVDDRDPDADGDGTPDEFDCASSVDLDGDGKLGCQDADADGDGVIDSQDPELAVGQVHHRLRLDDTDVELCGTPRTLNVVMSTDEQTIEATIGLEWTPALLDVLSIQPGEDVPQGSILSFTALIGTADGLADNRALIQMTLDAPLEAAMNLRLLEVEAVAGSGAVPGSLADLCMVDGVGEPPMDTVLTVQRATGTASVSPETSCAAVALVDDNLAPAIGCPDDVVLALDASCTATWDQLAVAADTCDAAPSVSATPDVPRSYATPTIDELIYTATDETGNSSMCATTVTVLDLDGPAGGITSPAEGSCFGGAVAVTDDFADNCDPQTGLSRTYAPVDGPVYEDHGHWDVLVSATDSSGNTSFDSVSFDIDLIAPSVEVLPATLSVPTTMAATELFVATDDDGAGGEPVLEELRLDGCVIWDGSTYGDGDGRLAGEQLTFDATTLCEAASRCGLSGFGNAVLEVRAVDCAGNETTADGTLSIWPPLGPETCEPSTELPGSIERTPVPGGGGTSDLMQGGAGSTDPEDEPADSGQATEGDSGAGDRKPGTVRPRRSRRVSDASASTDSPFEVCVSDC